MKKLLTVLMFIILLNKFTFASVDVPEYIRIKTGDNTIIELDLEEYLYGVVQSEMGINYKAVEMENSAPVPLDALKAQAIASRTYAVYNILAKGENAEYHVTNTTSNQVYKDVNVNSNVKKAVDQTTGQIVIYDGKVANTFFFATSGGHTEASENVWTAEIPYLKGVEDEYEINVKNHTTWIATYTKEDLERLFPELGTVEDIKIVDRSENDRVIELKMVGKKGNKTLTKNTIRTVMGSSKLRSQWFEVEKEGTNFVFSGRGFRTWSWNEPKRSNRYGS